MVHKRLGPSEGKGSVHKREEGREQRKREERGGKREERSPAGDTAHGMQASPDHHDQETERRVKRVERRREKNEVRREKREERSEKRRQVHKHNEDGANASALVRAVFPPS